jgi:predicted esterase
VAVEDLGFVHVFEPGEQETPITLLLLHGTGGDERDLLPLGRVLAPGAALLSPRGKVLERGMPRFFRRLAEGVFDEADLIARAEELAAFVQRAASRYDRDPQRMVAVGFSNGANIAGALLLLQPQTLRAAALFAPMVPLEPPTLPDLSGVAAFLSAGRGDPIAPPAQAERMAALLTEAGAATELHWHGGGHEVPNGHVALCRSWFAKLQAATGADEARPLP